LKDNELGNKANNNNNNNNNVPSSSSGSNNGNSGQISSGNELEIDVDVAENTIVHGNIQTIDVTVSDDDTGERVSGADVESRVSYASGSWIEDEEGQTNKEGKFEHTWRIGGKSTPGTFGVTITVDASGYNTETDRTTFEVIKKSDDTNDTSSQNNSTDTESTNRTLANNGQDESNDDLDCGDFGGQTNIPVGNNDPNNLDGDNDGIGCETDEVNNGQTNNNDEEEQEIPLIELEDTSTDENTNQAIEDSGIGTEEGDTNSNDSNNEEQDTNENESEENSEEQDNDEEENSDESDNDNNE